ncbi:erythrocyte vesicle protein 1, putative [Plasmodium gallinaceum]|uniref:Erythrocyte vesicle protein 1, putative n=1 Tax=Plasmodium gallinaceum TaxID=5849 RepID=A0A1J1H0S7_PLAGA|nr:erythrocyte vesicle protein 1, putative [Plasmodium gallinaceum]CRG98171.1 erythrocyte vesicle protein 1, putative [Plasmodium gallinaceum]
MMMFTNKGSDKKSGATPHMIIYTRETLQTDVSDDDDDGNETDVSYCDLSDNEIGDDECFVSTSDLREISKSALESISADLGDNVTSGACASLEDEETSKVRSQLSEFLSIQEKSYTQEDYERMGARRKEKSVPSPVVDEEENKEKEMKKKEEEMKKEEENKMKRKEEEKNMTREEEDMTREEEEDMIKEGRKKKREKKNKNYSSIEKLKNLFKRRSRGSISGNEKGEAAPLIKSSITLEKDDGNAMSNVLEMDNPVDITVINDKKYYEKMFARFIALILIFSNKPNNIDDLAQILPEKYMLRYVDVNGSLLRACKNEFPGRIEEFRKDVGLNIVPTMGALKYYFLFDRQVKTLYHLLRDTIKRNRALISVIEPLSSTREADQERSLHKGSDIVQSTRDLYDITLSRYNAAYKNTSRVFSFYFYHWIDKAITAIKKKDIPWIEGERRDLNVYLTIIENKLKYLTQDLALYIRFLFHQAKKDNLFSSSVELCYTLFFEHYKNLINKTIQIFEIHIHSTPSKNIESTLRKVRTIFQDHQKEVQTEIQKFYMNNVLILNTKELTENYIFKEKYRQSVANDYSREKQKKFISLLPCIFYYSKVILASATLLISLQNVDVLFDDLMHQRIKFADALEIVSFLEKHKKESNHVFAAFGDMEKKLASD